METAEVSTSREALIERLRSVGIVNGQIRGNDPWEDVLLPLAMIRFDPAYQRDVRQVHIKHIVDEYAAILFEPPLVNWREDGAFYGMDGQHRILAALQKFGESAEATCRLFYGLTVAQEALIFGAQDNRRPLTPLERFRGGLESGREPYMTINAIVTETGWTVATRYDDRRDVRGIQAVGALQTVVRSYGDDHLVTTLLMLRDCFGTEIAPPTALISGFAQFLAWYGEEYDRRHLVRRMREVGLTGLRIEADKRRLLDRVTSREAVGMAIVVFYNLRRSPDRMLQAWQTVLITRKGGGKPRGDAAWDAA